MEKQIIDRMVEIVGQDYVVDDLSQMKSYLYDETEFKIRPTADEDCIVVKPEKAEQISEIVKYANEFKVSVVARGGGTGLCGAAIPTQPSIIVSLERLDKVVEFDDKNLMITVESGMTLEGLLEALSPYDKLFFPVHPGDEGAQIGGMVVENAGGVRAVKHGIMRNHVKGVEIVLPTGELVNFGGKLIKNNMGYDLLHMIIGSEGTLGIVTKATLKLYPKNKHIGTLVVSFDSKEEAADVVPKILQEGITPLAIEYMEKETALESAEHLGITYPAKQGTVDLMFILDETCEDDLYDKSGRIVEMCEENGAVDSLIAETTTEQKTLLDIRSNVYTAYKENIADALDIAVPPSKVPEMINELNRIAKKYNTTAPSVGHIADGNVHNFIMLEDGKLPDYLEEIRNEMYDAAIKLGGTVTAEHGTGKTRKKHMSMQYTEREMLIMENIKKAFDPNNILNPHTIVD
ncbi:MAG: FAD-binding oxidoreductase [Eubacteriales bacterium]